MEALGKRFVRFDFALLVFAILLSGLVFADIYPLGDLDRDYKVGVDDLVILAEQWLDESGCTPPDCAELDGLDGVTVSDFSIVAADWLQNYGPPLVINEFMASNSTAVADPQGEYDDWIEIHNRGDQPVDVAGMYLTDDQDEPQLWQFPTGRPADTTIDPNGFLVVWADNDVSQTSGLHAGFQLSSNGEEIVLFDTDGATLIDMVSFGEQITDISYGRWPDSSDDLRFFSLATPDQQNNNAYIGIIDDTKFSHNRGFYDAAFSLTITCTTPDAEIYYTTDGSAPVENEMNTASSTLYTAPISINSNAAIRAAAIKTGWRPTNIDTHTYIFDASEAIKAMPAVCLVGDEEKTFYPPDGIMAYFTSRGIEYERPVSFEILDSSTGTALQEDCGIRIHGSDHTRPGYTIGDDWSTCWVDWWPGNNSNKIGFNLWFRSIYGENRLKYPLAPFIDVERFKSIVLRQGKNDACTPFVKDEWARRLFCEMGRTQVTGTFANLYLNGEHKSYYNPTARGDEEFYQEWYGSDVEFDVITQSGVRDGDATAWNSLLSYVDSHDLSDTSNYEYVASKFDIPTFIDFLILEIHIGNFDWPNNNWDIHRERSEDGIIRFSVWDAEGLAEQWYFGANCENCADTAFDDFPSYDPQGLNGGGWPICRLYRGLKANPEFRQLFADHIHRHFENGGILTEQHLLTRWWEVFGEVSSVLPYTGPGVVTFVPDVFIPTREPFTLAAFHDNDLFDLNFGYPIFNVNGSYQHGGTISAGDTVTITESDPTGTIYYTLDGSDPRTPASVQVVGHALSVPEDTPKKVLVPTGNIGTSWRNTISYNDSAWASVTGGVGYERGSGYESWIDLDVESQMYDENASCYIRIPFTVDGAALNEYTELQLKVSYDDGFVAWINGVEVHRVNFSGTPSWNSNSSADHETYGLSTFNISDHLDALQAGDNVLAIQGLNRSTTSSDFMISATLEAPAPVVEYPAGISASAIVYTGGFNLDKSAHLKSRLRDGSGQWSVLNEAVFAVGSVTDSLRVAEVMYHPVDPNDEFIELINVGAEPINLNLVRFTKGVDFTFGDESLAAAERILIVRNQTSFMQRYPNFTGRIAGVYEGRLSDGGDKIRLRDSLDAVIQEFTYKDGWFDNTDGQGFSLTIRDAYSADPNSWDTKDGWRPSAVIGGSPGQDDSGLIPDPGAIVINEVLAHSHAAAPDWIELYNTTDAPIHIGGWFLSDSNADDPNITKYEIPVGTMIDDHDYIVFYEDDHFGNPEAEGVHTPFALSEGGDSVYLRSGMGGVIGGYEETESFGASATNVAFGRHVKSLLDGGVNFVPMSANTPDEENAYAMVGPVVISEIMYNTAAVNTGGEYIELHNITGSAVTLQDLVSTETSPGVLTTEVVQWRFSDGIDFIFPPSTTIPADGYLIVAQDPTAFTDYYGSMPSGVDVLGPFANETKLSNGGEQIQIVRPGDKEYGEDRYWIRTERVTYDNQFPWPVSADGDGDTLSQKTPGTAGQNYSNDVINWQAAGPNPGQ